MSETQQPGPDRRHSRRIAVEGWAFVVGGTRFSVLDLSLGGARLSTDGGSDIMTVGATGTGTLEGPDVEGGGDRRAEDDGSRPLELDFRVMWRSDPDGVAGLQFRLVGQNLMDRMLHVLLDEV